MSDSSSVMVDQSMVDQGFYVSANWDGNWMSDSYYEWYFDTAMTYPCK